LLSFATGGGTDEITCGKIVILLSILTALLQRLMQNVNKPLQFSNQIEQYRVMQLWLDQRQRILASTFVHTYGTIRLHHLKFCYILQTAIKAFAKGFL